MDCGSDTSVHDGTSKMSDLTVSEARPQSTPHLFVERGGTNARSAQHLTTGSADAIITNGRSMSISSCSLSKMKALCAARSLLLPFKFTVSISSHHPVWNNGNVNDWPFNVDMAIGMELTSSEDMVSRQALREKYLEPYFRTQSQCKARFDTQAQGATVLPIRVYPFSYSQENIRRRNAMRLCSGYIDLDDSVAC